jgi:hypothetical protein
MMTMTTVTSLENGGHIITPSFRREKATKMKKADGARKETRLELVDVFWPPGESEV